MSTQQTPIYNQVWRGWNMTANIYTKSGDVIVTNNCFAVMFTNVGDTIARLNGMVIFPNTNPATGLGDSRTIGGHVADLYQGILRLAFDNPAGANPAVEIVQLFYTK